MKSFPTRERGLKFCSSSFVIVALPVVPHAGTWIEISVLSTSPFHHVVVPHAGTWIEIQVLHDAADVAIRRSPRGNVD